MDQLGSLDESLPSVVVVLLHFCLLRTENECKGLGLARRIYERPSQVIASMTADTKISVIVSLRWTIAYISKELTRPSA